ncbi:MAG: DUF1223 domain-containing protein [Usitatibacter sp.]
MRKLLLLLAMVPFATPAAECTVRSGPDANALVELYTSEGCSSCPPADRWLSSFAKARDPRVVPLAFHVSYWDYIGWKDAFADERYTERQRAFAKATGARSVYTPQVILGGRDFPAWHASAAGAIDAAKAKPAGASIEITSRAAQGGGVEGEVTGSASSRGASDLALVVAVTQNGLSSKVTAGENRGEKLDHNFVVRDLTVIKALKGSFAFKPKPDWNLERMSVVAFVQNVKSGEVLQALSSPVCR